MMQNGDILHCSSNRLIPRLIKWATKSKYNHTAIYLEIWGQPCIVDSQKNGTNIKTYENWKQEYGYTYVVHRNPSIKEHKDEKLMAIRIMSKVGVTSYDFASLLIRQPIRLLFGRWKKKSNSEEKMYCSEFVAWAHSIEESYRMTPHDLYEYCVKHNFEEIKL